MNMTLRYRLSLRRESVYYAFDDTTKTFTSFKTKDQAFDLIRDRVLIETQAEHLPAVLRSGTVSTNAFLRKVHNFALDMNWLPATVIPRRQWPAIHYKEKRAITFDEHQKIIAAEVNPERKTLNQLCWHLGGFPIIAMARENHCCPVVSMLIHKLRYRWDLQIRLRRPQKKLSLKRFQEV